MKKIYLSLLLVFSALILTSCDQFNKERYNIFIDDEFKHIPNEFNQFYY